MDMIVHQTVGPYLEGVLCRVFMKQFQIGLAILIIEKSYRTIVATLGYVMWVPWSDYASDSRHRARRGERKIGGN